MIHHVKATRSLILVTALAAASSNALLGQDRVARLREAYSPEAAAQIEAVVEAAGRDGVPVGPLYDKALEGAAKRVPPGTAALSSGMPLGKIGAGPEA